MLAEDLLILAKILLRRVKEDDPLGRLETLQLIQILRAVARRAMQ